MKLLSDGKIEVETLYIPQNSGENQLVLEVEEYNDSIDYYIEFKGRREPYYFSEKMVLVDDTLTTNVIGKVFEDICEVYCQVVMRDKATQNIVGKSFVSSEPVYKVTESINATKSLQSAKGRDFFVLAYEILHQTLEVKASLLDSIANGDFIGAKGDRGEVGPEADLTEVFAILSNMYRIMLEESYNTKELCKEEIANLASTLPEVYDLLIKMSEMFKADPNIYKVVVEKIGLIEGNIATMPAYNDIIANNNIFSSKKLYNLLSDDMFLGEPNKMNIKATLHQKVSNDIEYPIQLSDDIQVDYRWQDGDLVRELSTNEIKKLFDGNYESLVKIEPNQYLKVRITPTSLLAQNFYEYPDGYYNIDYYNRKTLEVSTQVRTYNDYEPQGIGWDIQNMATGNYGDKKAVYEILMDKDHYKRKIIELIIYGDKTAVNLTAINWVLTRGEMRNNNLVSKMLDNNIFAKTRYISSANNDSIEVTSAGIKKNDEYFKAPKEMYPINSVYVSTSVNPSSIIGGEWIKLKDDGEINYWKRTK